MLSWENVTKSRVSKNALQKNCNPFQQLATERCTFFSFFFDTKYTCDSCTLFYSYTWQFSCKNKKAPNFNWVDMCIPFFILFQRNIIAMLIRANNGSVSSYMFLYLWIDKSNLSEGFPVWSAGEESTFNAGDASSIHWVGKIPWRRKWQPTPVCLPEKSCGQRSLVGYSPWGCKESDVTEWLSKQSI